MEDKIRTFKQLQNEASRVRTKRNKSKLMLEIIDDVFQSDSTKLFKTVKDKCAKKLKFSNLMKSLDYNTSILESFNINVAPNEFSLSSEEKSMIHLAFREPFAKKMLDLRNESKVVSGEYFNSL